MNLLAHHFGVELFGREFSPETPMEHVVTFGVTGLMLSLMVYGAYAAARDFRRWRRGGVA
ncbi:MAG: hypothetical protein JNM56_12245 [Planctomycetia bacterium]|nr:hypothetical protein [Planctomycetia bacterium]